MAQVRTARTAALRRYPALAYLAGAVALALLLPSGLTLPDRGPSTLAEYAPVPGQGQGTADVADLGLATSGGGPGVGGKAAATTTTTPVGESGEGAIGGRIRRRAGTKRCVGNPPRQTEDPLSPPCVAFFEGDNGGATWKGVDPDEIRIAFTPSTGSACPRTQQNCPPLVDCLDRVNADAAAAEQLCHAYNRYFNERYQTYGREVRLFLARLVGEELDRRVGPFAHVEQGVSGNSGRRQITSVGYNASHRRSYTTNAPYAIGFRPDVEDLAEMAASYVCAKLAGRPARFSGDVSARSQPRRFALWAASDGPYTDALTAAMRSRCHLTMAEVVRGNGDVTTAARLRNDGVTSVVLIGDQLAHLPPTQFATQAAWFPEWIVPGSTLLRGADTNPMGRLVQPGQWGNAFGITVDYRRDRIAEQSWARAYREGCPDCSPPSATAAGEAVFFYDAMNMLFTGIQAAGPKLTPQNVDKGLHALPSTGSSDPYKPAAYFAPGNFTFVKDATAVWWDPTATAPDGGAGCYRLVDGGRRRRAGEWPAGDNDVKSSPADTCQGEAFES